VALVSSAMKPLGIPMPSFALLDTDGTLVTSDHLAGYSSLVIFMCNHCPFVIHLSAGLALFTREMMQQGLKVVAISSNDVNVYPQDGPEEMKRERERSGYTFPYLYDEDQTVARDFGATCTPDFFLFDQGGELAYRGQFDGSRPGNGLPVTGRDLREACQGLLNGTGVPHSLIQRPSVGCSIKWRDNR
jgi:peroxiredoxin